MLAKIWKVLGNVAIAIILAGGADTLSCVRAVFDSARLIFVYNNDSNQC